MVHKIMTQLYWERDRPLHVKAAHSPILHANKPVKERENGQIFFTTPQNSAGKTGD